MMKIDKAPVPLIVPNPDDPRLTERVAGTDQTVAAVEINVPVERPLTLYLNAQEIVTMMTIGDYPEYLALGYLLNQNMLKYDDVVTEVEYDDDLQVVVVRTEHVGRHNAVDKIAGWIYRHGVDPADKILYTTGRLTSEMVIKTVRMGIPILVSRSGFTAWGVELARQVGLTLVGRTRGKRFIALSGQERIVFDQNLDYVEEESARHKRKGEDRDE